jgi:hypothetical protein
MNLKSHLENSPYLFWVLTAALASLMLTGERETY